MGMKRGILVTVMVFTALLGLFGCGSRAEKTITSVDAMTLTLCGMRGSHVYRIEGQGVQHELRRYRKVYSGKENGLELEKSVPCSLQTMIDLMNTCGILRWDGFYGKHPKNVRDGIMFRFEATVNGGETVKAEGSANFPKGYRDFVRALDEMLAEIEND